MSIVIICKERYARNWLKVLKKRLPDAVIEIYPNVQSNEAVDFAVVWKAPERVLSQFPNLKAVQSLGAGVKHIFDGQEIDPRIPIARIVDPQLTEDMWEFTLMLALNHLKNTKRYFQQQQSKEWKEYRYGNIKSTTISMLGLGKIGRHISIQLAWIGFKVQGWSSSEKDIPGVKSFHGEKGLGSMLANTDILVNVLPLTAETTNILDKSNLQKLKEGAYLINIARGAHVVDADLLELIDSGHLSGAALDVFHEEPLPESHPFWSHPQITVMPHVAGLTNPRTAARQIVENYHRMKKGLVLLNEVSHERKY